MNNTVAFYGDKLRVARLVATLSLDELGERVSASRQYLHQLETGAKEPTADMAQALADALQVSRKFFSEAVLNPIKDDDCHFRKLMTTPRTVVAQTTARATVVEDLVNRLEKTLRFPIVNFPSTSKPKSAEDVEQAAEQARKHWNLGDDAPIVNMTRVLESAGAVVVHFSDISDRVDALSISRRRPIVIRSQAKTSPARLRFDLAHECGHLIMHQGVVTGDHETEEQAHRFAGAFLIPRVAFIREFPRAKSLDWSALYRMKRRWGMSVRAIVRRAYDLGMIDAAKYRSANIFLSKTGQSKSERYDDDVPAERPELLATALATLDDRRPTALRSLIGEVGLQPSLFEFISGYRPTELPDNVMLFSGP